MRKKLFLTVGVVCLLSACAAEPGDEWRAVFNNPPSDARPRVWWHWEDGNVTPAGIRADLEWMHRIGIGGFHHFDAALSTKPIVDKRLIYMDEGWQDAFRYAIGMADSLGMEVGIASSPGWSSTGGPWVTPDDAMKRLVWSTVDVPAGERMDGPLPCPETTLGYYRDIAVVAIPLQHEDDSVRSIKVIGAPYRSMWADRPATYSLALEATADSVADGDSAAVWHEVALLPSTTAGNITVNIPATSAAAWRIRPVTGHGTVPEYVLYHKTRVEHAEEKAGFSSPYDLALTPTVAPSGETFPSSSQTLDLTTCMDASGTLRWQAPDSCAWRVLRMGYTLTGKRNGPAPAEATGLEVDKFDAEAWSRYFHHYLDMYRDASQGLMGQHGVEYLLVDSYEAHWQTWTGRMAEEFASRRGYALLPWLPALTGEVLGSADATERFLFDWRRTIGELYAENYGRLQDYAREYGLRGVYLESQENGRVYVVDGMDVKRHATIPMAACWTPVPFVTEHSTLPMAVADMRESASVAHLYGRPHVAAESFTADGGEGDAYGFTPAKLKAVADLELASGINQFFIHESSHQPSDDFKPGLGLLQYGQWFNRHETWAEQARAWMDYLARSSAMLSQGMNVADVLIYYGEDTNITARYGLTGLPPAPSEEGGAWNALSGYAYDFVNPAGLFDLTVRRGRIVAPSGAAYRVLCLDRGSQPTSPEVEARISELRRMGAVVCSREDLGSALRQVEADVISDKDIRFVHRKAGKADIYWINKPSGDYRTVTLDLRAGELTPEVWDPVSGTMRPVSYIRHHGRTTVTVDMKPDDALFIVCCGSRARKQNTLPARTQVPLLTLDGEWSIAWNDTLRAEAGTLCDYTANADPRIRYFAGTAVYETHFRLPAVATDPSGADAARDVVLRLGRVYDLAEVEVNGIACGTLWKEPFEVSVAHALRPGDNRLTVRVTNVWVNRLIGDQQPHCLHPTTYTSQRFYRADSPLRPAGLLGPVQLYEYVNQ